VIIKEFIKLQTKSISTGAQYVTLDNKIICLSLAFFFCNPTNKTVTGTAYMRDQLIAKHLDQSLWSTNKIYWAALRSKLLHSFLEVHNCVAPFTSQGKVHEFGAKKRIFCAKPTHFDFLTINSTVWSHILSTRGDAPSLDKMNKLCRRLYFMGKSVNCRPQN